MAVYAPITPALAGERGRLRKPHLGPVTLAIRAVRYRANPASDMLSAQHQEERRDLQALRVRIAGQFAADAALLERGGA
ncbi:hypothetical protein [Methylobacterium sp. V23]|uniref:hypothetical protein n=1 Tax=Methylobacterium sp. V23 TaxID=2044878 RepID=UPI0011B05C6B|nr:hypothetical protein [Methylobacterium sp. V23]